MILQNPIGQIIFQAYRNDSILNNAALQVVMDDLVRKIKDGIENDGIEYASNITKNDLFKLRFELLRFLQEDRDHFDFIENLILKEAGIQYLTFDEKKKIRSVVSDSLEIYHHIFTSNRTSLEFALQDTGKIANIQYDEFRALLSAQLNSANENLLNYFEVSLRFDFLLIVAELMLENEIKSELPLASELEQSLRESIIDFASYSVILQFHGSAISQQLPLFDEIMEKINSIRTAQNNFILTTGSSGPVSRKSAKTFSGSWSKDDIKAAEKAIEEDCEKIDEDEWK